MRPEDVKIGREYLIRIVVTGKEIDGNMMSAVTTGQGEALQVHPDELIEKEEP